MAEWISYIFPPFCLDLGAEQLWRGDEIVRLTPKAFAILSYLASHAGQLVSKDALLDAVWSTTPFISDGALTTCIYELRQALGEQAKTPQFIETVRGRGYRFIAPISEQGFPQSKPEDASATLRWQPATDGSSYPMVGRGAELRQLHQWLDTSRQGVRQMGFLVGEAGIGKTTLAERFLAEIESEDALWIGFGQCIEQYGAGEAYMPLLEALGRLLRGPHRAYLASVLRQHAPSWLLQLPSQMQVSEHAAADLDRLSATPERMLRELAEAVEVLTMEHPLILLLEDLHWCDPSTLAWLSYMARRRDPARLLVLGTYRPVDAIVREHPVHSVVQELRLHARCQVLALDFLSEAEVATYINQRLRGASLPAEMVRVLHRRTSGNPLFLGTVVAELIHRDILHYDGTHAQVSGGVATLTVAVPDSLRQLIELQFAQLTPEDQELLAAASVVGYEFSVATVEAVFAGVVMAA